MGQGFGVNPEHPFAVAVRIQDGLHAADQPEIADKHGCRAAQEGGHRGKAPPLRCTVHHIVVQEGGVVQQFRCGGITDGVFVYRAAGTAHQQAQHGP